MPNRNWFDQFSLVNDLDSCLAMCRGLDYFFLTLNFFVKMLGRKKKDGDILNNTFFKKNIEMTIYWLDPS
jgi:hypothetical protein